MLISQKNGLFRGLKNKMLQFRVNLHSNKNFNKLRSGSSIVNSQANNVCYNEPGCSDDFVPQMYSVKETLTVGTVYSR